MILESIFRMNQNCQMTQYFFTFWPLWTLFFIQSIKLKYHMKEHLKTNILRGSLYFYDEKWRSNWHFPYPHPSKLSQKILLEHSNEGPFSHLLPGYGNGNQGFPIKDGVYVKSVVGKLGYIFCTRKPPQLIHYRLISGYLWRRNPTATRS